MKGERGAGRGNLRKKEAKGVQRRLNEEGGEGSHLAGQEEKPDEGWGADPFMGSGDLVPAPGDCQRNRGA